MTTKAEAIGYAKTLDRVSFGERWRLWRTVCPSPHPEASLLLTSDDPPFYFCDRCLCVWERDTNGSVGRLLNEPHRP